MFLSSRSVTSSEDYRQTQKQTISTKHIQIRRAHGPGRVKISYKQPSSRRQIDQSILYCFITSFIKYTPRARGRPWGPPGAKVGYATVSRPFLNGRKPPWGASWRLFWAHFRSFWRSWGFICHFYRFSTFLFAIFH